MDRLGEFLNQQYHLKDLRKNTYELAIQHFEVVSKQPFDKVYLDSVIVNAVLNELAKQIEPSTWNNWLGCYKRLAKWLDDPNDLNCPVVWRKVKMKKIDWDEKNRNKYLTETEYNALLSVIDSHRDKALVATCVAGALRLGELMSLKLRDVEVCGAEIRICVTGKTGTRSFVMNPPFSPTLKHWLNFHPMKHNSNAPLWTRRVERKDGYGSDYIGLHCSHINGLLKVYAKRAGIDKPISPHWLRHTRITWTAKRQDIKISNAKANKMFGWTSNSDMYSHYTHLHGDDSDDGFRSLDGAEVQKKPQEIKLDKVTCFNCNEPNDPSALYCVKCGAVLDEKTAKEQAEIKKWNEFLIVMLKSKSGEEMSELWSEWKKKKGIAGGES